jgi:hypothetical protein
LFESFGHTAVRICDTTQGIDIVYNYGVFDFNTDFFYLKFAMGRLSYMLARSSFETFMWEYAYHGRSVCEQVLHFTPQEKQRFIELIEENYLPENRYYQYDFFKDNCATRVRDMIANSLENREFPQTTFAKTNTTFRELYLPYTQNFLWWRLGIDIALGSVADRKITVWDCMYLPDDLLNQLDTTILTHSSSPLVESKTTILEEAKVQSYPSLISPNTVFWLLLLLIVLLTFTEWKLKKTFKWINPILFFFVGIVSLLVIHLWFISDHSATKANWNLLWANPLFFYVLIRREKTQSIVLLSIAICLMFYLAGFWFLPQYYNPAFFPIVILLLIRILKQHITSAQIRILHSS